MRYQWSTFIACFLLLSFPAFVAAETSSRFHYSEVSFLMEDSEKKDYVNQSLTLGDTFDLNSFGLGASAHFSDGYYLDGNLMGGYQARQDTEYYISDATIGIKKPFPLGSRVDVVPELGLQHGLKGICPGGPCNTSSATSFYIKLESRIWLQANRWDARIAVKKAGGFHRQESTVSFGYWPSRDQRFAIGYSNRSMTKGVRVLISYML